MLIAILVIGFLFLGLLAKVAKGVIRIVLIIIVIALMAIGSATTHDNGGGSLPATTNS